MSSLTIKKGRLLIAEPALTGDISFNRAVVLMVDHNPEGSVGFILNKALDTTLADLVPEVKTDFRLYNGGPVDQDNLYFLHKIPDRLPGSFEIADGIFWGGDFELLLEELKNGTIKPDEIKFFLGYSGWMPQQLDSEIKANSWIIFENDYNVFNVDSAVFWKEKMKELGGDYLIWSNAPENPNYN